MAGINDDVDEGLEPYIEPHSENTEASKAPHVTLMNKIGDPSVADNCPNNVKVSSIFGGPVIAGEVPNLDADFILVEDAKNRINDIVDVRLNLADSNGMCCEDAELVDSVAPGFINESRPLGYFTEQKTNVQFNAALSTLDGAIDLEIENLKQSSIDSVEKQIAVFDGVCTELSSKMNLLLARNQQVQISMAQSFTCSRELAQEFKDAPARFSRSCHEVSDIEELKGIEAYFYNTSFTENFEAVLDSDLPALFSYSGKLHEYVEGEPFVSALQKPTSISLSSVRFEDFVNRCLNTSVVNKLNAHLAKGCEIILALKKGLDVIKQANSKPGISLKDKYDTLIQAVTIVNGYASLLREILLFILRYFDVVNAYMAYIERISGEHVTRVNEAVA